MPKEKRVSNPRRSARITTQASTASSAVADSVANMASDQASEAPNVSKTTANINEPSSALTTSQITAIQTIVQTSLAEAMVELKAMIKNANPEPAKSGQPTNSIQPSANSAQPTENSTGLPGTLPDLFTFERLGFAFSSPPTQPGSTRFNVDGGFTPEIPSSYIQAIQRGEFFDIEKLLPENMHKISCEVGDGALSITVGSNSELKLVSRAAKKKIETVSDWTNAFTLYMKVMVARRKNLLAFACLFTFYACLFIFCACLFTFFLGANHKAPTFHVTLW